MNLKQDIFIGLKGFGMGAANVVPGVSGGTIALLTGIYQEIVDALNAVTAKDTWKSLLHGKPGEFWKTIHGEFLVALGIGIIVSIFSLAKFMTWSLETYPIPTWAFFFGLILASIYYMLIDIKGWKVSDVIVGIIGIVLGIVVCTLSPTETPDDMWFIFICAAIAICTMILPGISGSFILVILGKYDYIMKAVADLDWPVLIVFALGCVVGLLAFAKLLHWLLARWERQTMLVLIGFVLGSLIRVWPWADSEAATAAQVLRTGSAAPLDPQIFQAVLFCFLGVGLVVIIEALSRKKS